jgi:hypothetical protein
LKSPSQLSCQGQSLGRWMTSLLAERAKRPGTVISCRRIVAMVALAWKTDAMVPAARVRLNATAASTSHAPLDANWPEAIWPVTNDLAKSSAKDLWADGGWWSRTLSACGR